LRTLPKEPLVLMTDTETHTKRAYEALKEAGSRGLTSYELAKAIGTNYSPRRILDLKKAGYSISGEWEKAANSRTKRYFLNSPIPTDKQKQKTEMVFDEARNVYVEKLVSTLI